MTVTMAHREGVGTVRSTRVNGWAQHGVCIKAEPDALFVRGAAQQVAKQVCVGCPVIDECLVESLDNRIEFGVWGGMTERQRRVLLKRRPSVVSWRAWFEANRMRCSSTRPEALASTELQSGRRTDRTTVVSIVGASSRGSRSAPQLTRSDPAAEAQL